jgi:hypothetical protein
MTKFLWNIFDSVGFLIGLPGLAGAPGLPGFKGHQGQSGMYAHVIEKL